MRLARRRACGLTPLPRTATVDSALRISSTAGPRRQRRETRPRPQSVRRRSHCRPACRWQQSRSRPGRGGLHRSRRQRRRRRRAEPRSRSRRSRSRRRTKTQARSRRRPRPARSRKANGHPFPPSSPAAPSIHRLAIVPRSSIQCRHRLTCRQACQWGQGSRLSIRPWNGLCQPWVDPCQCQPPVHSRQAGKQDRRRKP
jgi:hypothetical protein